MRTPLITVLTFVVVFDALGWGLSVPPVLKYALTHRSLPTLGRIRLLSGPLEPVMNFGKVGICWADATEGISR